MQAYCQLARQGLGLMIFSLSGGGRGGQRESHAKICCVLHLIHIPLPSLYPLLEHATTLPCHHSINYNQTKYCNKQFSRPVLSVLDNRLESV